MTKKHFLALAIILASFIVGIYFYPSFPAKVASHWNANGEVDGYMSKFWGLFLMPIISIFLFVLFLAIPRLDPKYENIKKFKPYFDNFIILIFTFLFYIFLLTIFWNLGHEFNMIQYLIPAFFILFYYAGILISKSEMNWFIGIRTPWTLSSEEVWMKTRDLGAKLFKISAVISLAGLLLEKYAFFIVIMPSLASAAAVFVYSYVIYRKTAKI